MNHRLLAVAFGAAIALCAVAGWRWAGLAGRAAPAEALAAAEEPAGGPGAVEPEAVQDLPTDTVDAVDESDLELELQRTSDGSWEAVLSNHGAQKMLVVAPGDGSSAGWRTPLLEWTFEEADGTYIERLPIGRCGNTNPLKAEELLLLEPGATLEFTDHMYPGRARPDQYYVRLRYTNDPTIAPHWLALGPPDPGVVAAISRSTACTVQSNRVFVDRR